MEEQEFIIGMCGGKPIFGYPTDASEDTVIMAGKLGVVGYVKKPYMPQDFLERIEKVLKKEVLSNI